MGGADLTQGVRAGHLDRVGITSGCEQPLPLVPTHPKLLRQVVAGRGLRRAGRWGMLHAGQTSTGHDVARATGRPLAGRSAGVALEDQAQPVEGEIGGVVLDGP